MSQVPTLIELTQRYKAQKSQQNDRFNLRIHRALSWLEEAEKQKSLDHKFISLWIAFNSAYAREFNDGQSRDRVSVIEFLMHICSLDDENRIYNLIWVKFSNSIRVLLDNKFIFQPFWDYHNGKIPEASWEDEFEAERSRLFYALENKDTHRILNVLFSRFYTLRNQILHGGATFKSGANRDQLRDSCAILSFLLPAMLDIMLSHHNEIDWGKPYYPYVKE